ncbi:DDE-type integrase/transposase/recombinase [Planotetraspora mira]|uniref:DDE-type integrase/transposase/recombinase n=1 Tax=Planotetraspora mira TaxID=58121 RepID=UPI00195001D5|nr:DDE-type integrase/transposase/recombinase [Planotetraspora mira]
MRAAGSLPCRLLRTPQSNAWTAHCPGRGADRRPDPTGRDFKPDPAGIDSRWCGDITYIRTDEGLLYLATVIDIASRRVVGWATADHLRTELVADALQQAWRNRPPRSR